MVTGEHPVGRVAQRLVGIGDHRRLRQLGRGRAVVAVTSGEDVGPGEDAAEAPGLVDDRVQALAALG